MFANLLLSMDLNSLQNNSKHFKILRRDVILISCTIANTNLHHLRTDLAHVTSLIFVTSLINVTSSPASLSSPF